MAARGAGGATSQTGKPKPREGRSVSAGPRLRQETGLGGWRRAPVLGSPGAALSRREAGGQPRGHSAPWRPSGASAAPSPPGDRRSPSCAAGLPRYLTHPLSTETAAVWHQAPGEQSPPSVGISKEPAGCCYKPSERMEASLREILPPLPKSGK